MIAEFGFLHRGQLYASRGLCNGIEGTFRYRFFLAFPNILTNIARVKICGVDGKTSIPASKALYLLAIRAHQLLPSFLEKPWAVRR
jgi:hypothetical protein